MPAEQRLLDLTLPRRRALGRSDFLVSDANSMALAMIEQTVAWPNKQLAMTGPEGAGKTHLAHVWMELTGAEKVAARKMVKDDVVALSSIGAVVVEDVETGLGDEAEAALFHLLNLMRGQTNPVLITGRGPASDFGVMLPDLASRLAGMTHVSLDPPDDRLMRDLLIKQFNDRHLIVGDPVVSFLLRRINRSAKAIAEAVDLLDKASQKEARGISVPFAKAVMGL